MVKDEPSRMNEIIKRFTEILDAQGEADALEEIDTLMDELHLMIEQIDMAKVFTKFGGLTSLLLLLKSPRLSTDLRAEAAGIIAAIAQNNYPVQEEMFKMKTVQMLVGIYAQCLSEPAVLRAKIIMAMSCVVRQHPPSEELFMKDFAELVFSATVKMREPLVLRRAIFLGKALLGSDSSTVERVQSLAKCFLPSCLPYVISADHDLREGTLMMLQGFCSAPGGLDCIKAHKAAVVTAMNEREGSMLADAEMAEQEKSEMDLARAIKATLAWDS